MKEIPNLPKIKNTERIKYPNLKTKTELKKMKLQPTKKAVAYGLQQFKGYVFYLYDINFTEPYVMSEHEKELRKLRYKELKVKKTCPICGTIVRTIDDIITGHFEKNFKGCITCYKKEAFNYEAKCRVEREDILSIKRNELHDFTSHFINKGIDISCKNIPSKYETIYLDFETTGTTVDDEILQAAIIDEQGTVLFYKLFSPINHSIWDEAMYIHNISPADVKDLQSFETYTSEIENILSKADRLICYNADFELMFLNKYNIKPPKTIIDCMLEFAPIWGDWNSYYGNYRWVSLETAATYYDYNFENQHNSLSDVFATKWVYENIEMNKNHDSNKSD